jgi:hypothetical protein
VVGLAAFAPPALAQPAAYVSQIAGSATITRVSLRSPMLLGQGDVVDLGDRIATGAQGGVLLALDGQAWVRIGPSSVVTLTSLSAFPTITLVSGALVAALPFQGGTPVDVVTTHGTARVRPHGILVAEAPPVIAGSAAITPISTFTVLRAVADVRVAPRPASGLQGAAVRLRPGQSIDLTAGGSARSPRPLTLDGDRQRWALDGVIPPRFPWTDVPTLPARDWTLLVDGGRGFEPWIVTPAEGCVAGDCVYDSVRLSQCDRMAEVLARGGTRVACARAMWADHAPSIAEYRDVRGRTMTRGRLAGRLIVYEPGAGSWTLDLSVVRTGRPELPWALSRSTFVLPSGLDAATCIEMLRAGRLEGVCVRLPLSEREYRDAQGRVLATGPLAGALLDARRDTR